MKRVIPGNLLGAAVRLAVLAVALTRSAAAVVAPFDVIVSTGDNESFLTASGTMRVLVQGGHVSFLQLGDDSYGEVAGGDVSHVNLFQSARALVAGGEISHFRAHDSAYAELTGGEIGFVTAFDASRIDIRSGGFFGFATAGGDDPFGPASMGQSEVNMFGGSVGVLRAEYGGVVNLYGGDVNGINPLTDGVTNIYGGVFRDATLNPTTVTTVYGRGFHLALTGNVFGTPTYRWTGVLSDGTPLDAELYLPAGAVLNLVEIPEPASFVAMLTAAAVMTWGQASRTRRASTAGVTGNRCGHGPSV